MLKLLPLEFLIQMAGFLEFKAGFFGLLTCGCWWWKQILPILSVFPFDIGYSIFDISLPIRIIVRIPFFSSCLRAVYVEHPILRSPRIQSVDISVEHTECCCDQNGIMDLMYPSHPDFCFLDLLLRYILSTFLHTPAMDNNALSLSEIGALSGLTLIASI